MKWFLFLLSFSVFAQESERPPPFITTPDAVVTRMLTFAGTGPNDVVFDLGSGDGRIPIAAAKQFGARGHGIEIEGKLVVQSRENARRAGVADRVTFEENDVLQADLSKATVITVYLLPFLIDKLQPRFLSLKPGTRIVSHVFAQVGWQPDRQDTVKITHEHRGQGDTSNLYMWIVPAEVRGNWTSQGGAMKLRIYQSYQQLDIDGTRGGRPLEIKDARMSGTQISWKEADGEFRGRLEGGSIDGEFLSQGSSTPVRLLRAR